MSGSSEGGGYAKPPSSGRFSASNPGNRRGRPPGSKNLKTILREIAQERQLVKQNGETTRCTNAELLLLTLQRRALTGDIRAIELLDTWCEKLSPPERTPATFFCLPDRSTHEVYERRLKAEAAKRAYKAEQARTKV